MTDDNGTLSSAILSLLVAADQRCPAIIGQAHPLYHARSSVQLPTAAKTLAQLKRDADDLIRAIVDVEVAMKRTGSDLR
jgi:hypothetical protein